jgi:hypothetical protein
MFFIIFQNLGDGNIGELSSTIGFLTAMITPALLISASGTLVLTTSTRLGRVIDRARELEGRLNELMTTEDKAGITLYTRRIEVVFELLDKVTTRSRMLQKALFVFYCSLVMFVLTSLTIGVVGLLNHYAWIPIPIGLVGMLFVFYGSIMMMQESRLATATTNAEMDITWEIATSIAPKDIVDKYSYNELGKRRVRTRKNKTGNGKDEKVQ